MRKYFLSSSMLILIYVLSFRFFKVADVFEYIELWFFGFVALNVLTIICLFFLVKQKRLVTMVTFVISVIFLCIGISQFTSFFLGYSYDFATTRSNQPTINVGDIVFSRHFDLNIKKGDFVGFNTLHHGALRKRVVADSGDLVFVCGNEVYAGNDSVNRSTCTEPPIKILPGELFVLGDNSGNSLDSRYFGPIKKEQVIAKSLYKIDKEGHVIRFGDH